ncbi:hypothetical protein GGR56DRAFT_310209 [Xylariaceae sp. FL0804]|nr:hypothetical protein GGR56DRAFT_310209 [Xylariaceae sp. FL0804]
MSTLAMPAPHHHHPAFHHEFAWLDAHPEHSPRAHNEQQRVALPSIRQAFPELQLQVQHDERATPPASTSPTSGPFTGAATSPEYVHSPSQHKRRRLSFGGEREMERASQVPRLYSSPQRTVARPRSPPVAPRPAPELWRDSDRTSPYAGSGAYPAMRSPGRLVETPARHETPEWVEARPTLPSLPLLNFERAAAGEMHRVRSHSGDEYVREPLRRPSLTTSSSHGMDAAGAAGYRHQAGYGYGYSHPSRVQSLSVGSVHPFDQTPFFSGGGYGHQMQDMMRMGGDFGLGLGGESKQRKRRGNLPKETTDKLRAWFVSHLGHPYPTEDEKQEFVRQTGLQMNMGFVLDQISNWFINARRRQLPAMMSNARAESDAMSRRGVDGKVLPSTERGDYDHEGKPLSDGEGSAYDDVEYETRHRVTGMHRDRGSI